MTKRRKNSRKSLAIALGIVGVAGLSMASAAQLTVNNDDLAAGVDVVGTCDDAVDVGFTAAYNATLGAYEVSDVNVSGIAAGCSGSKLDLTLLKTDGTSLFSTSSPVTISATSESITVTGGPIAAADIDSVAVVIH
jgi:hypothetical protein